MIGGTPDDATSDAPPYDCEVLVIDFEIAPGLSGQPRSATSYQWTHGFRIVWLNEDGTSRFPPQPKVTSHIIGYWERIADGDWLPVEEVSSTSSLFYLRREPLFFTENGRQFLPYYELNADVRAAAGLLSRNEHIASEVAPDE